VSVVHESLLARHARTITLLHLLGSTAAIGACLLRAGDQVTELSIFRFFLKSLSSWGTYNFHIGLVPFLAIMRVICFDTGLVQLQAFYAALIIVVVIIISIITCCPQCPIPEEMHQQ
jgi:hypothetical protein